MHEDCAKESEFHESFIVETNYDDNILFLRQGRSRFSCSFFFKFCNPIFMKAQIWDDYQTSAFYSNKDRDYWICEVDFCDTIALQDWNFQSIIRIISCYFYVTVWRDQSWPPVLFLKFTNVIFMQVQLLKNVNRPLIIFWQAALCYIIFIQYIYTQLIFHQNISRYKMSPLQ